MILNSPPDDIPKPIDWSFSLGAVDNITSLAQELLGMLVDELPITSKTLLEAQQEGDVMTMRKILHRVKGSTCYCGVPYVKLGIAELETALKHDDMTLIKHATKNLIDAMDDVIDFYNTQFDQLQPAANE